MARRKHTPAPKVDPVEKVRTNPDATGMTKEKGFTGIRMSGGRVQEEFLSELRGPRGMRVLKEMSDNDPIIGAVLFAISMLLRQCTWEVTPFSNENVHLEHADKVRTMMHDMNSSWSDTLSEILSMLPYGWSFMEITYKKRNGYTHGDDPKSSKYADGALAWQNFYPRGQDTLQEWVRDSAFRVTGWKQQDNEGRTAIVPLSKGILFRTTSHKDSPEGRSILRNSYRPWVFKKRLEEIEAIGIERDLNGIPMLTSPEGTNIWDASDPDAVTQFQLAETLVRNLRRDEQEGIVKPFGWELVLLSSTGQRAIDTTAVIGRYNNAIAMTCLADFIVLGHNNRYGSKALAGNKTAMFQSSITGWATSIADTINSFALTKLYALNGWPVDAMCAITPKGMNVPDLEALSIYLKNLNTAGFKMFPNIPIEKVLLEMASLPSIGVTLGQEALPPKPLNPGDDNDDPDPDPSDDDDPDEGPDD